jgi:hypothetical protein
MKNTNIWKKENVARFNFTYALDGGAWLETKAFLTSDGYKSDKEWFSAGMVEKILGEGEFARLRAKQGLWTGLWIKV